MKHILRPYRSLGFAVLFSVAAGVALAPPGAAGQAVHIVALLRAPLPLLLHSSSQGYLGVDLTDVDQEKAQALKLKEVRGAVITLIDHDAPAGQIGLKVNDVVLQLNGQNVEGAEQLRRLLREIPAGRKVSLVISRDGNMQTMAVELVDRKAMEHDDSEIFIRPQKVLHFFFSRNCFRPVRTLLTMRFQERHIRFTESLERGSIPVSKRSECTDSRPYWRPSAAPGAHWYRPPLAPEY